MTVENYRDIVLRAVREHEFGDSTFLDIVAKVLEEQEQAKQVLREKGYGCTGKSLLLTVREVPRDDEGRYERGC